MKWNFRKIVVAAAVIQLGCFCTTAAEDSSSEKNSIIDEIVNTKIKEAKGADALSEVLDAVAEKIPLDTDKETPESSAYIEKLEEQARKKYPAADQELENKYRPIAEKSYPVYNTGDHITVVYLLHGKPFTVSGQYYRQDSRFVWIGSKKILKAQLGGEYASRFDLNRTKQLRASFVAQNIRRYHQQRELHFKKLKSQNHEKISELRGEIKFNGKWLPPRKVVMEKYAAAFARQDRLIAESIQKAKDSPDYNERCKILESVIQKYPDHKSIPDAETLLEKFKTVFAQKTEEVKNILAYCSQPKISFRKLNNEYKIDLEDRDILSQIQNRFLGIPGSNRLKNLLSGWQQKIFQMSRDAVKQLEISAPSQKPQLIISKKINVSSGATVWIFPMERKKDIMEFHKIIDNILSNFLSYKKHISEFKRLNDAANNVNVTGISSHSTSSNLRNQAIRHNKEAHTAMQQFGKYHDEAKNIYLKIAPQVLEDAIDRKTRVIALKSEPVTLSNIRGPVILFAFELFNFKAPYLDIESFQSWYLEYTPKSQTAIWDLK